MIDFMMSKAGVIGVAFVFIFGLERLYPMVAVRHSLAQLGRNFSLAGLNVVLGPLVVLPLSAFAPHHGLGLRPGWWNIALDLLVLDLWIYAWHRLNHVIPFLWRFHEVHHLDEALDSSTGLRFHFGEVALSACVRALLVWLLSVPIASVLIFETLIVVAALFQHSNMKLPEMFEQWLSLIIVTPSIHWVHHHALRRDTDSNYATMLSLWDLVFGSRSASARTLDMDMGVEGLSDVGLLGLVARPFGRAKVNVHGTKAATRL